MAKNLTDLSALSRAEGEYTDLVHVNASGVDYKQTKRDFLAGSFRLDINASSSIISQIEALDDGTYFGRVIGGTKATTGVPEDTSFYVYVNKSSNNYIFVELTNYGTSSRRYSKKKVNGTWSSGWVFQYDGGSSTKIYDGADVITMEPAYSGANLTDLHARRTGNLVFLRFNLGAMTIPTSYTAIGTLSEELRPSDWGHTFFGSAGGQTIHGTSVRLTLAASGVLSIIGAAAATNTTIRASTTYFIN